MAFRTTIANMERKGWEFSDGESECRSCGATVFWGKNPENDRNVSFDVDARGTRTANFHFKNCSGNANAPRPASQLPPPSRDRDLRGSNFQPPAESAPAVETHSLQESVDDLAHAIRSLLAEMKSRKSPPRAAPAVDRTGPDGEPYDVGYPRRWNGK